ncbi:MAG: ATP-dependent sacrificial sulfur transferase LarE [Aerococcaceae bacterium]|nr:ATP-dependent sacrificial sulfur transferase LarE [Aerococcaceae bacterium]
MEQLRQLEALLRSYQRVAIAFSGGIDSTLLAFYANQVLGRENVWVVIGNSELHKEEETQAAVDVAQQYGWQYHVVELNELACDQIRYNQPDSWYFSKVLLYQAVIEFAQTQNIQTVCDGMILDDLKDYRPGLRAREDLGIVSPLIMAKFDKQLVREAAKSLGIVTWNQIPSCSLISRFPYRSEISLEAIAKVNQVEALLKQAGFSHSRARYYQSLVKIELPQSELDTFISYYAQWNEQIKAIGFKNVALDLEGYQTGNMNATIKNGDR